MPQKLHVANLDAAVEDDELVRLFATAGKVCSAHVICSPTTGVSTGAGLITMTCEKENAVAVAVLNGREYRGRLLSVRCATSRDQTDADHCSMFGPMNTVDDDCRDEVRGADSFDAPSQGAANTGGDRAGKGML
jgi:RNA recognition motif-containing protein